MKWQRNAVQGKGSRSLQWWASGVLAGIFVLGFFSTAEIAYAGPVSAPPNNLGLVGYWSFNEGGGALADDFSGNGNAGTLTNMESASDWVDGRFGNALDFDGSDEYVAITNSLPNFSDFTISGWIHKDDWSGGAREEWFSAAEDQTTNKPLDWGHQSGSIRHWRGNAAGLVLSHDVSSESGWLHVVMTQNRTSGSNVDLTLYINGEQVATDSGNYENMRPSVAMDIGRITTDGFYWDGLIDEVRVYNRALSEGEVGTLYRQGLATIKQLDRVNLVGYWSFDEGSGSTVDDFSGRGQLAAGSVVGSPPWVDGRFGSALQLNGSSQYVTVPDHESLSVTTAVTMAAWVKPAGTMSNYPRIIQKGQNTAYEVYIHTGTTRPVLRINNGSISAGTNLPIDEWTFLVATYDSVEDVGKIYFDGELVSSANQTESAIGTNNDELRIGTRAQKDTTFNGIMDEVRIYESALSAAEVSALYKSTRHEVNTSRNDQLANGLVGVWSFDGPDVDDTTAYDRSGSGNNGTRSGTTATIGVIGQALSFDGVDDHVVDNTPSAGVATGTFTVSFWMKPRSASGRMMPFSYGANSTNQSVYFDWANGDQNIEIEWWGVNGVAESGTLALNEWHHVVGKYDGSSSYIYIDGEEADSTAFSSSNLSSGGYIGIGKLINWGGEFDGAIDDVRMYDRALSASEVQRLYRMGR